MRLRDGVLALSIFLTGCYHDLPSSHSDNLFGCIAPNGKDYTVDANTSHCRPGDDGVRCRVPDGNLIITRGQDACIRSGGWPLGIKRPDDKKNSN